MNTINNNLSRAVINRLKRENINYNFDVNKQVIEFEYNDKLYSMSVENFPFRPPSKFSVNNKIVSYPEMSRKNFIILRDVFNVKCLCCMSILCPNLWHLSYKFMDIIKEYEKFTGIINAAHNYKLLKDKGILINLPKEIIEEILNFLRL